MLVFCAALLSKDIFLLSDSLFSAIRLHRQTILERTFMTVSCDFVGSKFFSFLRSSLDVNCH